jgi:hypothetical protein
MKTISLIPAGDAKNKSTSHGRENQLELVFTKPESWYAC